MRIARTAEAVRITYLSSIGERDDLPDGEP